MLWTVDDNPTGRSLTVLLTGLSTHVRSATETTVPTQPSLQDVSLRRDFGNRPAANDSADDELACVDADEIR